MEQASGRSIDFFADLNQDQFAAARENGTARRKIDQSGSLLSWLANGGFPAKDTDGKP